MNVTSMTSVMKKLVFPLVVGGVLWSGSAQADDIVSIKSDHPAGTVFTSSGEEITFKVSLAGYFVLTNAFGGSAALLPELRMVVNGDIAYAKLYSLSQYQLAPGVYDRTDCIFRYRVKPGDMAQPMKIYGSPTIPYQFFWNGWAIRSATNLNIDAVWRFNTSLSQSGAPFFESYDIDLVKANLNIRTLTFDDPFSPSSVAATETTSWRVSSVNPTESSVVSFYVWTPGTNIIQIGSVPNQTALLVQMPTNTTFKDFQIKGLAVGTTQIYLQRPVDYANNTTSIGITNYIRRTINVTTPPEPTVRIVMTDTLTDNTTLDETTSLNTGSFQLGLSEAFSNDVWVRVDTTPLGQSNVTFAASPFVIKIQAGDLVSSAQQFSVPDGTVLSSSSGITLSPVVISNASAVAHFTRLRDGKVYVRNVKPAITLPLSTDAYTAVQHTPFAFNWNVSDVPLDLATGMQLVWNYGDGTTNETTHGAAGSVSHTYISTGVKIVKVRARDKDGTESDEVQFQVTVNPPVPQPHIRLAPSVGVYGETDIDNTGAFNVFLSESYTSDTWVRLETDPLVQSNIVFASTDAFKIPAGQTNAPVPRAFSVRDGTPFSSGSGIKVTPVITNATSAGFFTDRRESYAFVTNILPKILSPLPSDTLAPANPPYDAIPMGVPFTFDYQVEDVAADKPTMQVTWNFGDGTTLVVTGAVGSVIKTYSTLGDKYLWVEARDKDGGVSARTSFKATVVAPPPPPTVYILPPAGPLAETASPNTGEFTVQLSEAFTNTVIVQLTTTPANSAANGTVTLATNRVEFTPGQREKKVRFSARDGTDISYTFGFTVNPQVIASPTAIAHFTTVSPATIEIYNVNPQILNPTSSDLTAPPTRFPDQGAPYQFDWNVTDVPLDLPSMSVYWNFGDGGTYTGIGGSGTINHTYTAIGEFVVRVVATDKDGGRSEVQFKVQVRPAKEVIVTPIGPNAATYYGAAGKGNGMVSSPQARSTVNRNNVYYFSFSSLAVSATLEAIPYKTITGLGYYNVTNYGSSGNAVVDPTAIVYDSFFFVWVGEDQGLAAAKLDPATTTPTTAIQLPASSDTGGTGGTATEGVDIRDVQAIFSRELYEQDNMGDINLDGIPDVIASWMFSQMGDTGGGGGGGGDGEVPVWLTQLNGYNDDLDRPGGAPVGDFLPVNPTGVRGVFDFRPIPDPATAADAQPVNAFTALLEVRGYHKGLNRAGISLPDYGPGETQGDEPGTNPVLADTDGDGLPDGWEFWFWYQARMRAMTGSSYNPYDVCVGNLIESRAIEVAFNPAVAGAPGDFDNDGLRDVEELAMGTNPVHWDTDGDGICDGWEVMRTLDPNVPADGGGNPDGDYFAIATVERQLATVVNGTTTNTYLAVGAALASAEGTFTTWYNYGDSNAPLAVGRSVLLPPGAIVAAIEDVEALVLHHQVRYEFGFDPRTAWQGTMNYHAEYDRFPAWVAAAPNTRPFTSRDEYRLMKFMSENRMNGAGAAIAPTEGAWGANSTHPRTPDSDVDVPTRRNDGMPDGWELYVSIAPDLDLTVAANRNMTISPWNWEDGAWSPFVGATVPPHDSLSNRREFSGTESCAAYTNALLYQMSNVVGFVTITRPGGDIPWYNKFWPTNPWIPDTDGDGISDNAEMAFMYGTPTDNRTQLIQGGGLNPNAIDTDWDALPDKWELEFTGTLPGAGTYNGIVVTNGMDGTVEDYDRDWDADGLFNYQEYWVQAVRSLRYDIPDIGEVGELTGNDGLPMDDSFYAYMLFLPVENPWDLSMFPWGYPSLGIQLWYLPPVGVQNLYVSTDPRNPDSDFDGMDDYYEMYHGLNPILGMSGVRPDMLDDRIMRAYLTPFGPLIWDTENDWYTSVPALRPAAEPFTMDFVRYPWLAGTPESDPDADGLLNLEEMLLPNTSAPPNYNTDPTPLWLTDASNPESVVNRFYQRPDPFIPPMHFWPPTLVPMYMYGYEMNEGYDTDNDGVSDKAELVDSQNNRSNPQDHDDPMRRQAIWFSGLNSAASTVSFFSYFNTDDPALVADVELGFRSFTVELWARPEVVNRDQVLIERPFFYGPSDLSSVDPEDPTLSGPYVRRNYRIGIAADGRVYASFDNAGAPTHDGHTSSVMAFGHKLKAGEWVHLTARMDGRAQAFTLFVNGEVQSIVETALIPANGIMILRDYQNSQPYQIIYSTGALVLGAANNNPVPLSTSDWTWEQEWADYGQFYQGWIDEVRIWDGARDNNAIRNDYKKRFTRDDLWANRSQIAVEVARGYTREMTNPQQLSPLLMHHYTFDNLFGADAPGSVAKVPRGFNDPAVAMNRPANPLAEVPWWSTAEVRSTVYNDYNVLPWIENGFEHQPLFGGLVLANLQVRMTNSVLDSVYWTHTASGRTNDVNAFPNSNNPYGLFYTHFGMISFMRDLLPLGDAYARQADVMWDCQGPSEAWLETGTDADSDGLPDWWEAYLLSLYPEATGLGWNDLYPDGSGLTNGERYQRDVANGATPTNPSGLNGLKQIADSDGDGMPDWWEKIFNLEASFPSGHKGRDGAGGDPDLDGLSNLAEYQISEVYQYRYLSPLLPRTNVEQAETDYFMPQGGLTLGAMFSDHDFMEDWWEDLYHPSYVNRFVYDSHLDSDEDGWSNWAECRFSSAMYDVRPDLAMRTEFGGLMHYDLPIPVIKATLRYSGIQSGGNIVVQAYSDPAMDGLPDAQFAMTFGAVAGGAANQGVQKTQPVGYWENRTVQGHLSPGGIQPGTVQFRFTDTWTGVAANTGFDRDGILYAGNVNGTFEPCGTIDYITGKYTFDLTVYGSSIIPVGGAGGANPPRNSYIDCEIAYIQMAYTVKLIDGWPKRLYLSFPDRGYVREGLNYFFAFIDLNNNGTWDAGEPCGVPSPFATDIGWDINAMTIELTDYSLNNLRMTLSPGLRSEDVFWGTGGDDAGGGGGADDALAGLEARVRVRRTVVDGWTSYQKIVLDKMIALRRFLHEGDFLAQGDLGLDWGLDDVPTTMNREVIGYEVFVGDSDVLTNNTVVLTFTNRFDVYQAKAVSSSPINGGYVYASRPTFRWRMPEGYTAFAVEIRKGSATGPLVYQSGALQAPPRDIATGDFIWEAPIHAGNRLPNGQIFTSNTLYAWRVTALNPKFTLGTVGGTVPGDPCGEGGTPSSGGVWSDWKMFRLDVNAPMQSSGYGEIRAVVKYLGPATDLLSGRVKVQVYDNRAFAGVPVAQYTLTDTELAYLTTPGTTNVNAVLRGLAPSSMAGDYYVRAYIDHNENNERDVWESWGYANYYTVTDTPYDVRPFNVEFSSLYCGRTAYIHIEDADTDQDWFPDAWEYEQNPNGDFLHLTAPSADWMNGDTEITGFAAATAISAVVLGATDQDGDGLNDMAELMLGTNAKSASTAGDGYADGDKVNLGLAPQDSLALAVTGLGVGAGGAAVQWTVGVEKSDGVDRAMLSALTGVSGDGSVTYYIDYTASLLNPSWTTVQTGSVTLDGSQTFTGQIDTSALDLSKGFFRVRLAK